MQSEISSNAERARSAPGPLLSVSEVQHQPGKRAFSPSVVRHLIFNAENRMNSRGENVPGNGLAAAIIRVGRRVYIDLDKFDEWLEAHRQG